MLRCPQKRVNSNPPHLVPIALSSDFQNGASRLIAIREHLIAVAPNGIGFQFPKERHGLHKQMPSCEQLPEVSSCAELHQAQDWILLWRRWGGVCRRFTHRLRRFDLRSSSERVCTLRGRMMTYS